MTVIVPRLKSWLSAAVATPLAAAVLTGLPSTGPADGRAVSGVLAAVPAAGPWGRAIEVPGLGALNTGNAQVFSVSCGAAGSCAAGGSYRDHHRHDQGYVATERHGRWDKAIEVPGLGALNTGNAEVFSVSCPSAGNCAAGGSYRDHHRHDQGYVANEHHGRWGKAIEVPGLAGLNSGDNAAVSSVSCSSAGNCAAVGLYPDRSGHEQMFAASQRQGRWGRAIEVAGLGALNMGKIAYGEIGISQVSCASAGNCTAGGFYVDHADNTQGFVASEHNGRWGDVIELPGLGALNKGGAAEVNSVSCGAAGDCAAVGDYTDGTDSGQGFVADERGDSWGKAVNVPGLKALNDSNAEVDSVSCPSAGNCTAVGAYGEPYGEGFVASEKNGVWGQAIDMPGLAALNGRIGGANAVSCAAPGNCAAGGYYSNSSGGVLQGWVASERHGRWGQAMKMPGLIALNKGAGAGVSSVSCPPAGGCAAGGTYTDRHAHSQGFIVSQTG